MTLRSRLVRLERCEPSGSSAVNAEVVQLSDRQRAQIFSLVMRRLANQRHPVPPEVLSAVDRWERASAGGDEVEGREALGELLALLKVLADHLRREGVQA
jgi:hypothetical protein